MAFTKSMNLYLEQMTRKDSLRTHQGDLIFDIPVSSSQESSFEGFGSSPFGKLHRSLHLKETEEQFQPTSLTKNHNKSFAEAQKLSPGKMLFPKSYDTIIEQNSCNAVDMQMSKNIGNSSSSERRESNESNGSNNSEINLSSNFSFNGKIKRLNETENSTENRLNHLEHIRPSANLMKSSHILHQFSESFILKKYSNEKSPDLFEDDEDEDDQETEGALTYNQCLKPTIGLNATQPIISCNLADHSMNCPTELSFANDDHIVDLCYTKGGTGYSSDSYKLFKDNCRRERELSRRIRKCLAGVLPPPSVTIPQLDIVSAVLLRKNDIFNFINDIKNDTLKKIDGSERFSSWSGRHSLFRPTHSLEEAKNAAWRDILSVRQHGLCYNLNKASENNEYLSLSVIERFIGAETATSYMNSPSSAKKRSTRLKLLCQSPGNRLSHLAKRRAMFSSANLATQKSSTVVGPQILLDKKKIKNRRKATPKRATPSSKKKSRKQTFSNEIVKTGPSRETSKRALFQSPTKHLQQRVSVPKPPAMKPELANRVEKSKRVLLFTPEKQQKKSEQYTAGMNSYFTPGVNSQIDVLLKRKRNDCDINEEVDVTESTSQSSKLFKIDVPNGLTPRALKIKSQSFCIGAGFSTKEKTQVPCASNSFKANSNISLCSFSSSSSSVHQLPRTSSVSHNLGAKLQRAYSDNVAATNALSENQKKKLLWAVSQALKDRHVTTKHENFKQYASVLARVVKRIFQEYYQKSSTSNSETMLRLSKKYVYLVTAGRAADDIYLQAKTHIEETKRQSTARLSGYIGPEEYEQLKQQSSQSLLNQSLCHKGSAYSIFNTDNSLDSFSLMSQASSGFCGSTNAISGASQTSYFAQISQDIKSVENSNSSSATATIQTNASLQNSSSKSNLCGVVLRENVDCELRKSAQKNFTGKDQRNISPYTGTNNVPVVKTHINFMGDIVTGSAKARRHISFDS